jgi:hypothetical protein
MRDSLPENVYGALVHYPVYDKNHREVATCITNLDVHDMARCAATYGLRRLYLVTPMASQREYARRLMGHWVQGGGGVYNPHRRKALENVRVAAELRDVLADVGRAWGNAPRTAVTGARETPGSVSHRELRKIIFEHSGEIPYIIVFGTGWGLTEKVFQQADYVLEPITGAGEYNHLSVRCAAAITLDRLLG